ncbi:NIPSNAP family protein [Ectopseudomonas oleovorans]|uniref:NIPSNAP family protein n=1 Tax=Ectopseudomonas oleovorans TaxID=301 RepID=A0AA42Q8R6_ECTOL|nr:NIPSNAP family protein [Pseudomonas oleovorans]MDH1339292.1 NIPSNAP family protein [Pseudomonas oleovorans]MDH1492570.1 NIPSNAP family protein [Pseudomonas oleovorans]WGG21182.1 NIPSNAP family protein [Pseudomonas oleovorans]
MRLYELITFTVRVRTPAAALARLEPALANSLEGVQLMGCWVSEIGQQNRIAVLRGFASADLRQAERERYLLAADAFAIGEFLLDMQVADYSLFPFLEPLEPGAHGPFYELREYDLVPSGLQPTLDGWQKAVGPRTSEAYSAVYAAFYATSGAVPRYLHIWPYASLEQRLDVRTRAVADGVWPPENSAPQLKTMHSTAYLPAPFSPLS